MSARLRTTFTNSRTLELIHVRVWRRRLSLRLFIAVVFLRRFFTTVPLNHTAWSFTPYTPSEPATGALIAKRLRAPCFTQTSVASKTQSHSPICQIHEFKLSHYPISIQRKTSAQASANTLTIRRACCFVVQYGGISTTTLPMGRVSTPRLAIASQTRMPARSRK